MMSNLPAPPAQSLPLSYVDACRSVAECVRVDECKGWADKAAAVAAYAKMVKNVQLEADAKRIRLRATRRIGEIIGADGHKAVRIVKGSHKGGRVTGELAAVVPKELRNQARAIARLDSKKFEGFLQDESVPPPSLLARASYGNTTLAIARARRQGSGRQGSAEKALRFRERIADVRGQHKLLDFLVDRQPVRNLCWREVMSWAKTRLQIARALLLLSEGHDDERRVGDCVDEAAADRALNLCKED